MELVRNQTSSSLTSDEVTMPRRWEHFASVGTWLMAFTWKNCPQQIVASGSVQEDVEVDLRQAEFDSFWTRLEQEEESESFAYMVAELHSRQAAFNFFWAQKDEQENDDKFSYMISELRIREEANNSFWERLAQEEEDGKFSFLISELSLRQAVKEVDIPVPTSPLVHGNHCSFSIAGSPAKGLLRAKALFMNIQPIQASSLLSTAVDIGFSAAGLSSPIPPSRGSPNENAKPRPRAGRFRSALA
jgi:hypothetical protein